MTYEQVGLVRDWVIIIAGSLGILLTAALLFISLRIYVKTNALISQVQRIGNIVERLVRSPYTQVFSWLVSACAGFGKGTRKRKKAEEKEKQR